MTRLHKRHWWTSIAVAAIIHFAGLVVILRDPPQAGFGGAGGAGITVALGGPEAGPTPPAPPPVPEPQAEPVEPPPVEETVDVPEPVPDPPPVVEEPPLPEPEPEETVAEEPIAPVAEMEVQSPPARRPADAVPPPPEPEPVPETVVEERAPSPPAETDLAAVADTPAEPGPAAPSPPSGGAGVMAGEDYLSGLLVWFERHKEYPRRARMRGQEGTATVRMIIAPDGRVLDFDIHESSGYELLDQAVIEMVERAQPLPPIPETMATAPMELHVPVNFELL